MKATISERGNGFPKKGDYVPGDDGNLYEVQAINSRIQTGNPGSGQANYVYAEVTEADWDDCDEADEFTASVHIEEE